MSAGRISCKIDLHNSIIEGFSKFGVDVVVMRIPACEFLFRLIAKLPAKNFASSTKEVANISTIVCAMMNFLPLGNDINYHNTWG